MPKLGEIIPQDVRSSAALGRATTLADVMQMAPKPGYQGRPLVWNPDGTYSSEITITVSDPRLNGGRPTNIPSMYDGKIVTPEEAIRRVIAAGGIDPEMGQRLPNYPNNDAADAMANLREMLFQLRGEPLKLSAIKGN